MKKAFETISLVVVLGLPVFVNGQAAQGDLPKEKVVIDIDAPQEQVFRIAIPDFVGSSGGDAQLAAGILRNDFRLMPGYKVIDQDSIERAGIKETTLEIDQNAWTSLNAQGVIKGQVRQAGSQVQLELRFYMLPTDKALGTTESFKGTREEIRGWIHSFGNGVLQTITGIPGPFGTQIAYARKKGPGSKDVYVADMDGYGERQVSSGRGISMLPAFGSKQIFFTRMTTRGSYITNESLKGKAFVGDQGAGSLNIAPAICDGRMYFTSSRSGNSEIYSVGATGTDLKRLTDNKAIDLSPSCGPGNKLAFVSNRQGNPQIYTMNRDGSNVERVTFRGSYNQTPSWCVRKDTPLLAFTGRDGGLDVYTVNLQTQQYTRVTQGQGDNKDPTFSPDCRIIAFASSRRAAPGVYLASPEGMNQVRVLPGMAETLRWQR